MNFKPYLLVLKKTIFYFFDQSLLQKSKCFFCSFENVSYKMMNKKRHSCTIKEEICPVLYGISFFTLLYTHEKENVNCS